MLKKIITNKYFNYTVIAISYLFLAFIFRLFTIKETLFYPIYNPGPILFSLSLVFLNLLIIRILPKKLSITYYLLTNIFNNLLIAVQYFHYKVIGTYFTISEIFLSKEGLTYIDVITKYLDYKLLIIIIIFIIFTIISLIGLIKIPKSKLSLKTIIINLGVIITIYLLGLGSLFVFNQKEKPSSRLSPIYNYLHLEVPYRSIQSIGIIDYNIKDVLSYIYSVLTPQKDLTVYETEIKEYLGNKPKTTSNEYTGIFKDKNLIYIMLESGDDWLIDEEHMPTLSKLQKEGLNFTNRYSPFFYGGYTFNAEFAANTGLYLTEDFNNTIDNYFPYSLPNLFTKSGYIVNSFHMNNPEFYERGKYHLTFGYSHYYGGYNTVEYKNKGYNYVDDTSWITNPETYNLLVPKNQKFMSFLITYSMHLPYINNELCDAAIRNKELTYNSSEELELNCLHYLSSKTDLMLTKLLEKLEEDKLLDDTVLILFADHDTYGYSNKDYLAKVKNTPNLYLQQKTPLIIWSKDIEHKDIDILMDTADLVPTIANMFGLDYDNQNYLSTDVFSKDHDDYIYFQYGYQLNSDNTFIDNSKAPKAVDMINYNKYILKSDYYRKD